MGDIADMMLDGDLCQVCGEYMPGGDGFPRTCYGCEPQQSRPTSVKEKCPHCGKHLNPGGTAQHIAAKHPSPPKPSLDKEQAQP